MDPYQLLGIAPNAPIDEAEDAYRHLLRVHHPDLHQGGTADEIAEAEAHTRRLNEAIEQIRGGAVGAGVTTGASSSWSAGAPPSWAAPPPWGAAPSGPPPPHDPFAADGPDPTGTWRASNWDERPGETYFGDAHAVAPCPLCGALFVRRDELTAHVKHEHHLRLAREPRPSRFRGSFLGRTLSGLQHVSLVYLVPFNALIAAIAATLIVGNRDPYVTYWVFGVFMGPTFIRVVDRSDHLD